MMKNILLCLFMSFFTSALCAQIQSENELNYEDFLAEIEDQLVYSDAPSKDIFIAETCNSRLSHTSTMSMNEKMSYFCEVVTNSDVCSGFSNDQLRDCSGEENGFFRQSASEIGACIKGLFNSAKDLLEFLVVAAKFIWENLNSWDKLDETSEQVSDFAQSIKLYLLTEYDKNYEEATGWPKWWDAGMATAGGIFDMLGQKVSNYVEKEYTEFGCLNEEAKTEKICHLVGDIIIPPAAFFGFIKAGRKGLSELPRFKQAMSDLGMSRAHLYKARSANAANIIRRELSIEQERALIRARVTGRGEVGHDGRLARIGNYTQEQIERKIDILKQAGFSDDEIRKLLGSDVLDLDASELAKYYLSMRGADALAQEQLLRLEHRPQVGGTSRDIRQTEEYSDFLELGLDARQARATRIQEQIRTGVEMNEDDFLLMMMQKGSYQSAFSPGVQAMAKNLKDAIEKGLPKEQAQNIIREHFESASSVASNRRMNAYMQMIDDIYEASDVNFTITPPHTGLPVLSGSTRVEELRPPALISKTSNQLEDADFSDSTSLLGTTRPSLLRRLWSDDRVKSVGISTILTAPYRGYEMNREDRAEDQTEEQVEEQTETSPDEQSDEAPSESTGPDEKIKIRLTEETEDFNKDLEPATESVEFEVEAYYSSGKDLPEGEYKWDCSSPSGDAEICKDSGFSESGSKQNVKLFKKVPYTLIVTYVPAAGGDNSLSLEFELEMPCGGLGEDLCDTSDQGDSDDEESQESEYRFWWEDLPPNQAPPPFQPGPVFQRRSFITPAVL